MALKMKAVSTIRQQVRALRGVVELSKDPIEQRIAYVVENALRWATEDVKGWTLPVQDATEAAAMLRAELTAKERS